MRTMLRRMVAVLAMAVLGGTGVALATAWSPTAGFVAPAAAGDDDDGGGDDNGGDDDGQVPAGGVDTGLGGAAGDDDGPGDDDDGPGDDDDGPGDDDDGADDDDGPGDDDDGPGDDDDGPGDDDGGQGAPAPAPAPAAGGDDDDDGDDDGGQVPVGGVQTGFGGTAENVSSTSEPSNGLGDVAKAVAPATAVGLGGYALLRARAARSDGAA